MNDKLKTGFADRLKTAAAAKQALVDKLRPQPTRTDPQHAERPAMRAAELDAVRQARTVAKADRRQAAEDAVAEAERIRAADEEAALLAKRGQRKERKALSAAEAKASRDAKYAARQARR
jgi:hypothetical protein